jgi:NAD(P)-dependent dehydrogenase (short-subunit alcohol dehydrogenase family)
MAEPEEIAEMALYLASEKGKYITGKIFQVDGGQIITG